MPLPFIRTGGGPFDSPILRSKEVESLGLQQPPEVPGTGYLTGLHYKPDGNRADFAFVDAPRVPIELIQRSRRSGNGTY